MLLEEQVFYIENIYNIFNGILNHFKFMDLSNSLISRAGSVADFPFRYPASVKPYQFRDTERRNCILAYPQLNRPTNRK